MHKTYHRVEDVEITLIIALAYVAALMQVGCKNMSIFIDGTILNNGFLAFADLPHLVKPAVQKINLQMKGPARHVVIKIPQVRVVINRFVKGCPVIMFGKFFG